MRVLINAVSVREGGPRVVLEKLLGGMLEQSPASDWIVASGSPSEVGSRSGRVNYIDTKLARENPLKLLHWYEVGLPHAVARWHPNVVFSMTNYLPLRRLRCPTVLLEQHAGHFSPEFGALTLSASRSFIERLSWRYKSAWVRKSVRSADALLVQTKVLADKIAETRLRHEGVYVVPHGPGLVECGSVRSPPADPAATWRIGYISKFGVQKDFDVLFRAAKALSRLHNIRLVLTLDPTYAPVACVLRAANDLGISDLIENRGELTGDCIARLYDSLDVMVFCSTCESFGFPMVEAMARGIPTVVADTPENIEITASAALRFQPHNDKELADRVDQIMADGTAFRERSEKSLARAREFSWTQACRQTLSVLERTASVST